jgi:outer membrane protein assembly factor BamB
MRFAEMPLTAGIALGQETPGKAGGCQRERGCCLRVRLTVALFAVLLCVGVRAAEWPEFRGPTADGISTARNVPTEWSATEHVAWKQAIPGVGWSSPVIADGKIYLTTAVGKDAEPISLRAMCVDTRDGHVLWDTELFKPDSAIAHEMHSKNSLASPTPIVNGDRLYVHFGHMGTAALDLKGNVIWRQSSVTYHPQHGNGGSPLLVDGELVFSCDGRENPFITALDRETGNVRWKTDRNTTAAKTFSFCTPTLIEVEGVRQIVLPGSGFVGAYDPKDGHELWRVNYDKGYSVVPRPVFARGLLFVSSGYDKAVLYAIDPKGAQGDATDKHIVWKREKGAPLTPSPLAVGDDLYFVSDNGVATSVEAKTGKQNWTKRLGGDFSASPVFAEGRIYFENEAGATTVVKAAREYEAIATNDLGEPMLASPAVMDGAIFLRTENNLWRIEN